MKKLSVIIVPAIVLLICPYVLSQEKQSAEDILRWFPRAYYSAIYFVDFTVQVDTDIYSFFKEKFGSTFLLDSIQKRLPSSLNEEVLSCSKAKIRKTRKTKIDPYDLPEDENGDRTIQKKNLMINISGEGEDRDLKITSFEDVGPELYVYRFADLDSLIKKAVKKGNIERTEQVFLDRPVYSFRSKDRKSGISDFYCYATDTQELLLAEKPSLIKMMVDAGSGVRADVTEAEAYVNMVDIVPGLGDSWKLVPKKADQLRSLREMREEGKTDEEIEAYEKEIESKAEFEIRDFTIRDKIIEKYIEVYSDQKFAADAEQKSSAARGSNIQFTRGSNIQSSLRFNLARKINEGLLKKREPTNYVVITNTGNVARVNLYMTGFVMNKKYSDLKQEKTKTGRDGNWFIKTTVWDKEMIEAHRKIKGERQDTRDKEKQQDDG